MDVPGKVEKKFQALIQGHNDYCCFPGWAIVLLTMALVAWLVLLGFLFHKCCVRRHGAHYGQSWFSSSSGRPWYIYSAPPNACTPLVVFSPRRNNRRGLEQPTVLITPPTPPESSHNVIKMAADPEDLDDMRVVAMTEEN